MNRQQQIQPTCNEPLHKPLADDAHINPYGQLSPEAAPQSEEEGDLLFAAMLAEINEEPVAERAQAFQSTHTTTELFHSSAIVSPPPQTQTPRTSTRRPVPGWKLSIGALGVVLLLIITIAALLLHPSNIGKTTSEKHASVTTVVTTLPTSGVTRNVQTTATPAPTPRPTVRPTSVSQHPTSVSSQHPAPAPAPTIAPATIPTTAPTTIPTTAAATVYSFEDGALDSWQVSGCSFANSTTMARTGGHSLVITQPNVNTGTSDRNPYLYLDSGNVSLLKAGEIIGAYIYVPSGSGSIHADVSVSDANDNWTGSGEFVLSPGSWNYISYTAKSFAAPMGEIGINLYYAISGGGTVQPVYIDNISW